MMEENILSIRKAKTQVTLRSFRILNDSLALKQITHLRIFKTKIHLDSRREPDHESVENGRS